MPKALALRDVKVVDLMWVIAGPAATRTLADYGATVVRVESPTRMDTARTAGPHQEDRVESDSSAVWNNNNAEKLGIALDLSKPTARSVFLDLVRWADIVAESFSPGAMRRFGLHYEALREIKPDIIMLSTCLMGQTGPLADFAGYGNLAAAVSGFYKLCGWPDRAPAGPFGAYTDYVTPRFMTAAILAALDHRRRTGEGQYIDHSQVESALHFLTPGLLDCSVNHRSPEAVGNYDPEYAPHGVYPTLGEDRWVAIACGRDQWRALCTAMASPELARDSRFANFADRQQESEALDRLVSEWTRQLDRHEVERRLQAHGVPASAVQDSADCIGDEQLLHRGHFAELPHPTLGKTTVEGPRFRLSRTPGRTGRAAPTPGQDNQYVLERILNYSEERIRQLAIDEALG